MVTVVFCIKRDFGMVLERLNGRLFTKQYTGRTKYVKDSMEDVLFSTVFDDNTN